MRNLAVNPFLMRSWMLACKVLCIVVMLVGCHLPARLFGGGVDDHQGNAWAVWALDGEDLGWHIGGNLYDREGNEYLVGEKIASLASYPAGNELLVLSGRDHVRAGGYYNYPTTEVYLWDLRTRSFRRLTDDRLLERSPATTQSGRFVSFFRATRYLDTWLAWPWTDWVLVLLDVQRGEETIWDLFEYSGEVIRGAAIHPDESCIVISIDEQLFIANRMPLEVRSMEVAGSWPVFSEDGSILAYASRTPKRFPTWDLHVAGFVRGDLVDRRLLAEGLRRPIAFSGDVLLCEEEERGDQHMSIIEVVLPSGTRERLATYRASDS